MYASAAHSGAPYAADEVTGSTPPGQVLPPPIPGGTTAYYWSDETGIYPWSYRGYAGARPLLPYLPGGVVVVPDPDAGVMRVRAWWPYAKALVLVRIGQDGSREPVRGGYGLLVADTRTNWCTNPSVETGLNGYVPDAGNPTLTRVADATESGFVLRATIASAGSNGVTVPTTLTGALPVTIGADVRLSGSATGLRVVVQWTDITGATLTANTVSFSADDIVRSVGAWARQVATLIPPAGALTPTVKIIADGMASSSTMSLDGITIEQTGRGYTDGSRFDGDTLGGLWTGAQHLSSSALAAIVEIPDGECPLDVAVTYLVADLALTGGLVTSPPVTLDSRDSSWLTHPAAPDQPFRVNLRTKPVLTYKIPQGVFRPIGRRNAVVVTAARQSAEGTLDFNALSRERRYELAASMEDGQPVLVRAPADYDWDPRWVSLGDSTHDPEDRLGWQDAWKISAPFTEVDAPTILS